MQTLAKKLNDTQLEALACNCIGVDYLYLAASCKGVLYDGSLRDSSNSHLEQAAKYHQKHLEITDEAGQFVAHTNLGLTFGSMGNTTESASQHQDALKLSIKLKSTYGQSLAVGNLGMLASRQGDSSTATACFDQHLQLAQSLNDYPAECRAWIQLGLLANREKKYEQAVRYLEQAHTIAGNTNELGVQKQVRCYLGVTKGNLQMEDYMSALYTTSKNCLKA